MNENNTSTCYRSAEPVRRRGLWGAVVFLLASLASVSANAQVIDPCWRASRSAVGNAVYEQVKESSVSALSNCAEFSREGEPWLINIHVNTELDDYYDMVADMIRGTSRTISISSLHESDATLDKYAWALYDLHMSLAADEPVVEKPVARFQFWSNNMDGKTWDKLTRYLQKADPVEEWNVRVAVRRTTGSGWTHAKMVVRDEVEVISGGIDIEEHDLALHLWGEPAIDGESFYDLVWEADELSVDCEDGLWWWDVDICRPKRDWEYTLPPHPQTEVNSRRVPVFSLGRGRFDLDTNFEDWSSDEALYASFNAAEKSIFASQDGLTRAGDQIHRLFDTIADNAKAGKDIKLISDQGNDWDDLYDGLEDRFNELGMSSEEKEVAHCLVRFAKFKGVEGSYQGPTHNKTYMLDHQSFYVGSQNMYPSGLRDYWGSIVELKDHGFFIDTTPLSNADLAQTYIDEYAAPAWHEATDDPGEGPFYNPHSPYCDSLPHGVTLTATSNYGNCIQDFDLAIDYYDVELKEKAKVTGQTSCVVNNVTVVVDLAGVVDTDNQFVGTISGSTIYGGDSADLLGTFEDGVFDASFFGLEPVNNVVYSGTVTTTGAMN